LVELSAHVLRGARETGTQVIWDLAHWGWPDDLDIWTPAFIDRFARFAEAAAKVVRDETDALPFYVPVNEIWSWAGGSLGFISPLARDRGNELKAILVQAAIAAIEAVRRVEPRGRSLNEPLCGGDQAALAANGIPARWFGSRAGDAVHAGSNGRGTHRVRPVVCSDRA
jgi:hypothetical protein